MNMVIRKKSFISLRPCLGGALLLFAFSVFAKDYPLSDHYDGKKFFNPGDNQLLSFWQILKWKMNNSAATWPVHVPNRIYPTAVLSPEHKAAVTFINHATFLLQYQDLTILTDPIFSSKASPSSYFGPHRVREPGLKIEELPKIDVIIISHNHYDHMDLDSLKLIDAKFKPLILVPLGDEKLLLESGVQNVREMDWWQEEMIRGHKIVFTPSQHWSARGFFDQCQSLWGSYYIQSPGFKTYFGGDTGYSDHFKKTQTRLGAPDLALLPIGAYAPEELMRVNHMTPEDAIKAHGDLKSALSVGMHFGTFQLTDESMEAPLERIEKAQVDQFIVLDIGESKFF